MEPSTLNWVNLSHTSNQDSRVDLCDEDYAKQARQFIGEVNLLLQKELQRITTDGQSRADVFWQHNKMMRATKARGHYGTRVRLVNNFFSAEWYENIFISSLGNKPLSRYIAKGRENNRYPSSAFKKANPSWEKGLIEQIEQQYEKLRVQAKFIYELRKIIKKYQRAINDIYGE